MREENAKLIELLETTAAGKLNKAFLDAAVDGIIIIDEWGKVQSFNKSAERLFGYSQTEMLGKNVSVLMPRHYAKHHDSYIRNYVGGGKAKIIGIGRDVEGKTADGQVFPLHLSVGETELAGAKYFIGICHDLTEYKNTLAKLADAERRYKEILEGQTQLLCRIDRQHKITFANQSFCSHLGQHPNQVLGTPIAKFATDNKALLQRLLKQLFRAKNGVNQVTVTILMEGKDSSKPVEWTFSRPDEEGKNSTEIQGLGIDVSEREVAIQQAEYFRDHDGLTGLLNKHAFLTKLKNWSKTTSTFSVLHIDLENFGLINQKHGFEEGNRLLVTIADRLASCLPETSICCRVGGDDFLVATKPEEYDGLALLTEKIQHAIQRPITIDKVPFTLDAFVGVASFPADTSQTDWLPEMAESAMKDARKKNESVAIFDASYHDRLKRHLDVEQALKRALEKEHLTIALQPKYEIATSKLNSCEVLVRWHDEELGAVSPAEFVPIAERSHLGVRLDRYVLQQALSTLAELEKDPASEPVPLAINITPNHFSHADFSSEIIKTIENAGVSNSLIELELTEGAFIAMTPAVKQNLNSLQKAGIRVAIDDFGTGFSSLSYLKNLKVDELKIDKSFIEEIETETGSTVVRSVINIAKAYDLRVTAEGIEESGQLEQLRQMGCDLAQGYYLGKPQQVREIFGCIKQPITGG